MSVFNVSEIKRIQTLVKSVLIRSLLENPMFFEAVRWASSAVSPSMPYACIINFSKTVRGAYFTLSVVSRDLDFFREVRSLMLATGIIPTSAGAVAHVFAIFHDLNGDVYVACPFFYDPSSEDYNYFLGYFFTDNPGFIFFFWYDEERKRLVEMSSYFIYVSLGKMFLERVVKMREENPITDYNQAESEAKVKIVSNPFQYFDSFVTAPTLDLRSLSPGNRKSLKLGRKKSFVDKIRDLLRSL